MKNAEKLKMLSNEVEIMKKEIIEVLTKNYAGCMIDVKSKMSYINCLVKHQEEILLGSDLDTEYNPNLMEQLFGMEDE